MANQEENKTITAYKAFNADWTCRDFQYDVGQSYHFDGDVEMCERGFHACTVPFDCWKFYPGSSTFAEVKCESPQYSVDNDSKIATADITICHSLSLKEWIEKQAQVVIDLCKTSKGGLNDMGHAAAAGVEGHAAAAGGRGHAAAAGAGGCAVALGAGGRAKAASGGFITLAHFDEDGRLLDVSSRKVGGRGNLKPNTWYTRDPESGKFVKAE